MFEWRVSVAIMAVAILGGAVSLAAGQTDVYVSTTGSDSGAGTQADPFATLNKALGVAGPGDVITMLPGVYRQGDITIQQGGSLGNPVTIQGLPGAQTILKGSQVATGWQQGGSPGLWYVPNWTVDSQQLFVDGSPLQQIGVHNIFQQPGTMRPGAPVLPPVGQDLSDVTPGTFYYDAGSNRLYGMLPNQANPNQHMMEASVKNWILHGNTSDGANAGDYVTLRNLTFMHANGTANGGRGGLVKTGDKGWTIDNSTFAYGDMAGLALRGEDHIVRNSRIVFNGNVGLSVNGSHADRENSLIEDNTLSYNNYRHFQGNWGAGGVKLIPSVRGVTVRHNVVVDNQESSGIWFDWSLGDNRVEDNFVWGNSAGIHIEATRPAPGDDFSVLVRNNIVVNSANQGIYLSGSRDAIVENNTADDNRWSVVVHGMPRDKNGVPLELALNSIINNIIGDGENFDTVLFVGTHSSNNTLEGNFYVVNSQDPSLKISLTTTSAYGQGVIYTNLNTLRQQTTYGDNAVSGDPQWVNPAAGDYRLGSGSAAAGKGSQGDRVFSLLPYEAVIMPLFIQNIQNFGQAQHVYDTFTVGDGTRTANAAITGTQLGSGNATWQEGGGSSAWRFNASGQAVVNQAGVSPTLGVTLPTSVRDKTVAIQADLDPESSDYLGIALASASSPFNNALFFRFHPNGDWDVQFYDEIGNGGDPDDQQLDSGNILRSLSGFDTLALEYDLTDNTVSAFINGLVVLSDYDLIAHGIDVSYINGINGIITQGLLRLQVAGPAGTDKVDNFTIAVVPEPGTLALLALGGLAMFLRQRRV